MEGFYQSHRRSPTRGVCYTGRSIMPHWLHPLAAMAHPDGGWDSSRPAVPFGTDLSGTARFTARGGPVLSGGRRGRSFSRSCRRPDGSYRLVVAGMPRSGHRAGAVHRGGVPKVTASGTDEPATAAVLLGIRAESLRTIPKSPICATSTCHWRAGRGVRGRSHGSSRRVGRVWHYTGWGRGTSPGERR